MAGDAPLIEDQEQLNAGGGRGLADLASELVEGHCGEPPVRVGQDLGACQPERRCGRGELLRPDRSEIASGPSRRLAALASGERERRDPGAGADERIEHRPQAEGLVVGVRADRQDAGGPRQAALARIHRARSAGVPCPRAAAGSTATATGRPRRTLSVTTQKSSNSSRQRPRRLRSPAISGRIAAWMSPIRSLPRWFRTSEARATVRTPQTSTRALRRQDSRLADRQSPTAAASTRAAFGPAPAPRGGGSSMTSRGSPPGAKRTPNR